MTSTARGHRTYLNEPPQRPARIIVAKARGHREFITPYQRQPLRHVADAAAR